MINFDSKSMGAELASINLNGKEMLFQGEAIKNSQGEFFWNRQAPILFPIVGKLNGNKMCVNKNEYFMGQHGFARDMEFKVLEKNEHIHKYYLEYNENTLKMYPFKFKLYVIYLLNGNNLTVEYVVENIDDKEIIFGIGGHPAFSCNILSNDYYIKFEKVEEKIEVLQLKEGLISNFKVNCNDILEKNQILNLNKYTFINDAIICKNVVSNKVTLNSHSNGNILEFDFTGFPYIAFWSKVGAPFVCIEPWYTTADKYESKNSDFCIKENMIHLDKGKKFNCKYTIKFN